MAEMAEKALTDQNIPGKIETSSEPNADLGDVIGDIFYKSMKNFFEVGFKLAESLNLEFNTENQDE